MSIRDHYYVYTNISPIIYVFAFPLINTRSPKFLHASNPLLFDSCMAARSSLPKIFDQKGIRVVCADPVTGSSSIPDCGAKNLDTKSTCDPRAVAITPLAGSVA